MLDLQSFFWIIIPQKVNNKKSILLDIKLNSGWWHVQQLSIFDFLETEEHE
jgi:hypothetical protein